MSGSTITLASTYPPNPLSTMNGTCTYCGNHASSPDEAQRRIQDLEAQVRLLNAKAAAAVDKLADYEDEVRSLRSAHTQLQHQLQDAQSSSSKQQQLQLLSPNPTPPASGDQPLTSPTITPTTTAAPTTTSPPRNTSRLASLSSFLPGRKRDTAILPNIQQPTTPSVALFSQRPSSSPSPGHPPQIPGLADPISTTESNPPSNTQLSTLQANLETERALRLRAESNLNQTQSELEELTATLFGQANEMVAEERKARAKLEERVKVLEDRDGEKRRRLERLEAALKRIERVRSLVREEMQMREEKDKEKVQVQVDAVDNQRDGDKRDIRMATPPAGELRVVNDTVSVKS